MENLQNQIQEKVIAKIKEDQLKPKPLLYFIARDYSLWLLVVLTIILASFCIAPIIFIIQNIEYGYIKHISSNIFLFILLILPYPWLLLGILTTYFAKKTWERTKHGYRFNGKHIVTYSIFASLALAFALNNWNIGKDIDDQASREGFGYYKSVEQRRQENWFNPDEGRFIGIVSNVSTTSFILNNENNNFSETMYFSYDVPGIEYLSVDNPVRLIGYKNDDDTFFVCAIFPSSFEPIKQREDVREKIKQNFVIHPECKEIFEKGRANSPFNLHGKIPKPIPQN